MILDGFEKHMSDVSPQEEAIVLGGHRSPGARCPVRVL